jgi:hypothetical protein
MHSVLALFSVVAIISVVMDAQKVHAILDWPPLHMVCAMCTLLGLVGYYSRFIKNYGAIVAPLTVLLHKDGFRWSLEAVAAFWVLQQALMMAPVLQHPDFDWEYIVECDVSRSRLGAVLHQGGGPMFFSRALAPRAHKACRIRERSDWIGASCSPLMSIPLGAPILDEDPPLLPQILTRSATMSEWSTDRALQMWWPTRSPSVTPKTQQLSWPCQGHQQRQELNSNLALIELVQAVQASKKGDRWQIVDHSLWQGVCATGLPDCVADPHQCPWHWT